MTFFVAAAIGVSLLFAGILFLLEAGRRLGRKREAEGGEGTTPGVGAIEGAVYGLLGLLLAFSFSGAADRFGARRALIVQEANAVGTAYLRVDLLPEDAQPAMRELFRRYLDARLEAYAKVPDMEAAMSALARSTDLQAEIWSESIRLTRGAPPPTAGLLLPALNEMFDITTTRLAAARTHPPLAIFAMLIALALVSALLAGHAMAAARHRPWLHQLAYATVMAVTLYLIFDLEFPRLGLIRVDAADQLLRDVRNSMN